MYLNNREIAFVLWVIVGLVFVASSKSGRACLYGILMAFFCRPILITLGLMVCYVATNVWLLSFLGWWEWSNLKTTAIWGAFALLAVFNFQKIETDKGYLRKTILEAIGINAIIAFIVSSHTFRLTIEIALWAVLIVVAVLLGVSERRKDLARANKILTGMMIAITIIVLANSIYYIATEFGEFATSHTAREFAIPVLLTALFAPFLFALYIQATYENVISAFKCLVKDPGLRRNMTRKLILGFWLDTAGLKKWQRHVALFPPTRISEIDASIQEIKKVRHRERRPYRVPPIYGWLPGQAMKFLSSESLSTNDYHRTEEGWWAQSECLEIGDDIFPNNIRYCIKGTEFVVSKLKLVLKVNSPKTAKLAYERFANIVSRLIDVSLPGPRQRLEWTMTSDSAPVLINGYTLALKRIDWTGGIKGGHELVFTMKVAENTSTILSDQ